MLRACFALPLLVVAVTSSQIYQYVKVDTSFPDSIEQCLLSSVTFSATVSTNKHVRCGSLCSQIPYCSLYCLKDTTCDFFRAKVTSAWVGTGSSNYLYDHCFSVHPGVGDVALGAPTEASSVYIDNEHSNPVTPNFFCMTEAPCYESSLDNRPWWRVDLGAPRRVTRARISLGFLIDSDIEFRVGNDTTVTNNPELLPKATFTPYGGLELVADTPIIGRYFFVTEPRYSDIRICDVWVMTK